MVQKVALLVGGVGAAAVLALSLALGGFVNAGPVAAGLAGLGGVSPEPSASVDPSPEPTDGATDARVQTIYVEDSSGPDRGPGGGDDRGTDADDRRGRDEDSDDLPAGGMDDFDDDADFDTHTGTNTGADTGTHTRTRGATGTHGGGVGTHDDGTDTRGGTRTNTGGHDG